MSAENHRSNENPVSLGAVAPSRPVAQHLSTRLIHAGTTTDPATGSVNVPIYQTSTYRQVEVERTISG